MDNEVVQIRARNPFPDAASTDYARLVELARQRKQLIAETINALPARLSEHGMTNLRAHLERQKRGMKYFPEPK
jgi:transposase